MTARPSILISGGGIGGLAAAIALAGRSFDVQLVERAEQFSEVGAGLQLGANAVRRLDALGVAPHLEAKVCQPRGIRVFDAMSGRLLTVLPLGSWARERYGGPYWCAHRRDLHDALLRRARELANLVITSGWPVDDVGLGGGRVRIAAPGGREIVGDALIIAEGVWSENREMVAAGARPRFCGKTASRTLIAPEDLPEAFGEPYVNIWLSRDVHVVHYPVRAGALVNVVIIANDDWRERNWSKAGDRGALERVLSGLAPNLRLLAAAAPSWLRWPLYQMAPLERWSNGVVALLGDAAHPVLPFLAQGAALAIEDAVVLGDALDRGRERIGAALEHYEAQRRPRARWLQEASRRNGEIYHMSGIARRARNAVLAAMAPSRLMARYDWVYTGR